MKVLIIKFNPKTNGFYLTHTINEVPAKTTRPQIVEWMASVNAIVTPTALVHFVGKTSLPKGIIDGAGAVTYDWRYAGEIRRQQRVGSMDDYAKNLVEKVEKQKVSGLLKLMVGAAICRITGLERAGASVKPDTSHIVTSDILNDPRAKDSNYIVLKNKTQKREDYLPPAFDLVADYKTDKPYDYIKITKEGKFIGQDVGFCVYDMGSNQYAVTEELNNDGGRQWRVIKMIFAYWIPGGADCDRAAATGKRIDAMVDAYAAKQRKLAEERFAA